MEAIASALAGRIPPHLQKMIAQNMALCPTERLQANCDSRNAIPGKLTGYDCPECKNRGWISVVQDGQIVARDCRCRETRASMRRIERSGLRDLLDVYTFDRFVPYDNYTQTVKKHAMDYVAGNDGQWFFVGGQVGFGKTHLCTAIAGEVLRSGKSVRYMQWRGDSTKIKAVVNDDTEYALLVEPLKTCDLLYIDDLWKTGREGASLKPPTAADVNLAFELINHRYNDRRLRTVISCEYSIDQLLAIDEAVGSRIYERTKGFCVVVPADTARNYRMRGM